MRVVAAWSFVAGSPLTVIDTSSSISQLSRIAFVACAVWSTIASSSSVAKGMSRPVMSSTRRVAISAFAVAIVRPSSSTSRKSVASFAVRSSLMVVKTARTTSVTISGSISGCRARMVSSLDLSASIPRGPTPSVGLSMTEHFLDLVLERFGVEGLDDIVGHPRRLGGDDVFGLAFGRYHNKRHALQAVVGPYLLQQLQAGHRRHVPVADHQAEIPAAELRQRIRAVRRLLDVVEFDLLQQVADDPQHSLVVVHDQNIHGLVDRHFSVSSCSWFSYLTNCHPRDWTSAAPRSPKGSVRFAPPRVPPSHRAPCRATWPTSPPLPWSPSSGRAPAAAPASTGH